MKKFRVQFFTDPARWFGLFIEYAMLLLVEDITSSHSFGEKNYIFQKDATLFYRSTCIFMLCCINSIFLNQSSGWLTLYREILESLAIAKQK